MDRNLTSKYENYKPPIQDVVILVSLNGCGCFLGTTANALVIFVIWSMRHLRTSRNFILASLSGSDLITCVLWQPLLMDSIINGLRFDVLVSFCTFFASLSSLNNLLCLTVERFIAVHLPFRYLSSLNASRVAFICFLAYSISFVLAGLIATAIIPVQVIHIYIIILTLGLLLIYLNIYLTAMKQVRKINALHKNPFEATVSEKRSTKTIKTSYTTAAIGIVVVIFFVSWLPYILLPAIPRKYFSRVFPWINTCAILQSNINPFLYFWKFAQFREESKRCWKKMKTRVGIIKLQ